VRTLAIDLFCGLGGWTEGLLEEGWGVVGFDIEEHVYGDHRYPGILVVQDVTALHGSWFKDAALIVASPPCQEYSYMAMPWSRAKAKAAAIRADGTGAELARLTRLFRECFRIQREACEAAGRHIPLIVENVKGAQPWVGKAQGKFGSFYLWGDVPELPKAEKAVKVPGMGHGWKHPDDPRHVPGLGFNTHAERNLRGEKGVGPKWDPATKSGAHGMARWTNPAEGIKNNGGSWFNVAHNTTSGKGRNPDGRGVKQGGDWFAEARKGGAGGTSASFGSKSTARKMASAMIAKIPEPLSRHIAQVFKP
jgi:C-5 cytosine-specific DNA methylase